MRGQMLSTRHWKDPYVDQVHAVLGDAKEFVLSPSKYSLCSPRRPACMFLYILTFLCNKLHPITTQFLIMVKTEKKTWRGT